jgi:hypothetical protein
MMKMMKRKKKMMMGSRRMMTPERIGIGACGGGVLAELVKSQSITPSF